MRGYHPGARYSYAVTWSAATASVEPSGESRPYIGIMQGRLSTRRAAEQATQAQQTRRAETEAQIGALTAQRSELQGQAGELSRRRNQLDEQRHLASGAARADLEARIREIDTRTAQIDERINNINDRIVDAMDRLSTEAPVPVEVPQVKIPTITIPPFNFPGQFPGQRGPDPREIAGIMAAEAVVLVLIGVAFWRFGMRRMREQLTRAFASQESQMTQLQNAVDTIAVEVERISEGQRYVAKALGEGAPADALAGRRVMEPGLGSRNG